MKSNVVWDGHESVKRIMPEADSRPYWYFVAGFLFGVAECLCIVLWVGGVL